MPYICNSVTPYISSNCSHCCAVKRRRRAAHQPQGRHVLRGVADRLVQQDVEHGRHAGRERDAVLLHPFEEAAVREPPGDVHGQALLQERQQAQHLRRVPAERAVFQGAVVLGQAEEFQGVEAVHPVGGVVVDDDLRPRRGARGAEDAGGVRRRRFARAVAPRRRVGSATNSSSCGSFAPSGRPRAEAHALGRRVADHGGDVDLLVIEDQRRLQRGGQRRPSAFR